MDANSTPATVDAPRVPLSEKPYLTPREVGEVLSLGRTTVYKLLKLGEIPYVMFGSQMRIPTKELFEKRCEPAESLRLVRKVLG